MIIIAGMSLRILALILIASSFLSWSMNLIWMTMDKRLLRKSAYAIIMILSNSVR